MSVFLPSRRGTATRAIVLTVVFSFSLPLIAESGENGAETTNVEQALSLPPEVKILPDPPGAEKRLIARDLSVLGSVAGVVLAGWGISVVFQGITEDGGEGRVHQGIALTLSGSLTASLFSAAVAYYSGPPE